MFSNGILMLFSALIQARFGEIAVTVVHGDITNDNSDVIVNSVGGNFILSQGTGCDNLKKHCSECTKSNAPIKSINATT